MKTFLLALSIFALVAVAFSIDEERPDELETDKNLEDNPKNTAIPSADTSSDNEKDDGTDDDSDEIVIVYGPEAPTKESKDEKQDTEATYESNYCNDHLKPVYDSNEHGKLDFDLHRLPLHHKKVDHDDIHKYGPLSYHVEHDPQELLIYGPHLRHERKHKSPKKSTKFGKIDKRVEANLL